MKTHTTINQWIVANPFLTSLILSLTLSAITPLATASGDDEHGHEEEETEHVEISEEMAAKVGIRTVIAGAGEINQVLTVYGKAAADSGRISHIRARFSGIITRVNANIGDAVEKGEILAEVESNDSLKRYSVKAPFAGIVTSRHATLAERTEEQALFTVANFDQVWAEFQIFPSQIQRIAVGQTVLVSAESTTTQTRLQHLIPSDSGQPFVLARAPIDNRNGRWTPGLLLEGKVTVNRTQANLVVDNRALQTIDGGPAVFVKDGDEYEVHPLTLGQSDSHFTAILEGLHAGDEYVVENSYLLKADLEKAGASHEH